MAKPIELETVLKGDDALAFHKYMEESKSRMTPEGDKITKEAIKVSKRFCFLL